MLSARAPLARLILIASVIAGVSYIASWDLGLPQAAELTWKGAGVALLALYAGSRARSLDGWLLTAVMAFGALGDVLLSAAGLIVGALAFLVGHVIAIWLYLRNRRLDASLSQKLLALILVPATVLIAFLLAERAPGVGAYALGLSLMAATAWTSRFPRYRTGIGAIMFVVSDLLIFAREGPLMDDSFLVGLAVWGLYYFGQMLICLGVSETLSADRAEAA